MRDGPICWKRSLIGTYHHGLALSPGTTFGDAMTWLACPTLRLGTAWLLFVHQHLGGVDVVVYYACVRACCVVAGSINAMDRPIVISVVLHMEQGSIFQLLVSSIPSWPTLFARLGEDYNCDFYNILSL